MKKTFLLICFLCLVIIPRAQVPDSTLRVVDTASVLPGMADSQTVTSLIARLISENNYLNSKDPAQAFSLKKRNPVEQNDLFYALVILIFLLAISRRFFSRYFSNMFRVFFNSSLRQSQLTDQLMQEKVPSLIFNSLFIIVVAFYLCILFTRYYLDTPNFNWHIFSIACGVLVVVYVIKFLSLKFVGWISGYKQEADIYIFIIFLINKIIGICLLPVIVIMAFTEITFSNIALLLSFILIGLLLLMRFFRSYGLLQHRLSVNKFHFLLYIVAMELLPIALIYKAGMMFVTKIL